MKKHQIPGNKRCHRCGGPTRNVTPLYCLPCLIAMNGQQVVDFALDARFHKNSRFSGPRLLAFAEQHPGSYGNNNKSILYLNPIIIMGVQQAQQDIKTIVESSACCGVSPIIRQSVKSAKSRQPRLHGKINELLAQLITVQDGLCPYCASPLTPATTHLDTVLPTGFDHSQICLTTKLKYYEANALAGNLKAVCGTCNLRKGWAENRGAQMMRLIASGKYPAQPVKSTDGITACKPRIYFTPQELPGKKQGAYTLAEWETLKQAIECFALRITYPCHHKTDWLFARWLPEARTLIFGCNQCVPTDSILAVNVASKNWMRIERHYESPRRKVKRQWVWVSWTELEKHMPRLRAMLPTIEQVFESRKNFAEKFHLPPPPPIEVLKANLEARAAEADVHFEVHSDMRRVDAIAEIARHIEREEIKRRQKWRWQHGGSQAGGKLIGTSARN